MMNDQEGGETGDQDAPGARPGEEGEEPQEQETAAETFLVNKDVLPDAAPGHEYTIKVIKVHDNEVECEIGDKKEEDSGQTPPPDDGEAAPADIDLRSMMT